MNENKIIMEENIELNNKKENETNVNNHTKEKDGYKIDYLKEDQKIPGQNYVCLSFISPEGIRNTTVRALKIRGVFESEEKAKEYAAELQKNDPGFHVFVGEVGKWLPWDPSPDDKTKVKDSQYYEKELQNLAKALEETQERAKKAESDRKISLMEKAFREAKKQKENEKYENEKNKLRRKLRDKKKSINEQKKKKIQVNNNLSTKETKNLKEKEKILNMEKERINDNENKLKESEKNLKSLDENLHRLKEIYAKMQNEKKEENAK